MPIADFCTLQIQYAEKKSISRENTKRLLALLSLTILVPIWGSGDFRGIFTKGACRPCVYSLLGIAISRKHKC